MTSSDMKLHNLKLNGNDEHREFSAEGRPDKPVAAALIQRVGASGRR